MRGRGRDSKGPIWRGGMEELNGTKGPRSASLLLPSLSLSLSLSLSFAFLYLGLSLVGAGIIFLYMSMYAFASLKRAYGFDAAVKWERIKKKIGSVNEYCKITERAANSCFEYVKTN